MSVLPTTRMKTEPRKKAQPVSEPLPAFSTMTRIKPDEQLTTRQRAALLADPKLTKTETRQLQAHAITYRCAHNIYPDYTSWRTTCLTRTTPARECACSVTELDSAGARA